MGNVGIRHPEDDTPKEIHYMKKILTNRQQEILDFIEDSIQKRGYPPTLREIGNEFGISSTNGVRVHLAALEKKQYIIRHPWLSRGIELVNVPKLTQTDGEIGYVPIIDKVAAGVSIFDAKNIEGMLAIDDTFLSTKKVFALKIKGDSMIGMGIMVGDYILARRQHIAESGDIVVYIVGGEITVKRYEVKRYKKNTPDQKIAGKVVGLIRKY